MADGREALAEAWNFMAEQCDIVLTGLASALGPPQRSGPDDIPDHVRAQASTHVRAQADAAAVRTELARVPLRGRPGHGDAACYHCLQQRR